MSLKPARKKAGNWFFLIMTSFGRISSRTPPVLMGASASLAMLLFYFAVLTLANSPVHALSQFKSDGVWIVLLSLGFGTQFGLFSYAYGRMYESGQDSGSKSIAASGGISAGGMIACCAHHASDVLPFLGLSVLAGLLYDYRLVFIAIGLTSNVLGIIMVMKMVKSHSLAKGKLLKKVCRLDLDRLFNFVIAAGLGLVIAITLFIARL